MGTREWLLTAAVILVPLIIAVVVTLWSLKQVKYRRKVWQAPSTGPEPIVGDSAHRSPAKDDSATP